MKKLFVLILSVILVSCTVVREGPYTLCIEQYPHKDSATLTLFRTYASTHTAWEYDLTSAGVLPHNTPKQNSDAIRHFFAGFKVGAAPVVRIPAGDYQFDTTISIPEGLSPRLLGDNGYFGTHGTRFFVRAGDGIHVSKRSGGTVLEHIYLIGAHPESQYWAGGGKTGVSNIRGFYLQSQATLSFCTSRNFDYGFVTWANISSEGSNGSSSLYLACHALENRIDGFMAGIEDANVIAYVNCDARDNGRYGFNDFSFLGNNYLSCMTHNNPGGAYYVRDLYNSRSTFVGCYSEEGQAPSQLRPRSVIIGGLWGSGYKINDGPVIYK